MERITVKLKKKEVLFLASLIGIEEFIGIENTMFSLSEEEIKEEWIKVQNSLEEKQFIEVGFDGTILIDELINAIISTCGYCDLYLGQKVNNQDKKVRGIHYYISEYLAIKMEEDISDQTLVEFELLFTVKNVKEEVIKGFHLEDLPKDNLKSFTITENLLDEVKTLSDKKDTDGALKILLSLDIDHEISAELLELISHSTYYNSLIMIHFTAENTGDVSEMIFIQSKSHLWHCKLNILEDTTIYEFIPRSYKDSILNINSLIKQVDDIYIHGNEELVG